MNIWAPKGMNNRVCVKIPFKGYEISIAMDDSCGAFQHYQRSNIRVFRNKVDVTERFMVEGEEYIDGDAETFAQTYNCA